MVVADARKQRRLIDQLFLVLECVRLAKMSEISYELLTKVLRPISERSSCELRYKVVDKNLNLSE